MRWLWLAAMLLFVPGGARAQLNTITPNLQPLGYCSASVTTGASSFVTLCHNTQTGLLTPNASMALIIDETGNTRWTDDGVVTPTTTTGMFLTNTAPANTMTYTGDLTKLRFAATPASSILDITVYATH